MTRSTDGERVRRGELTEWELLRSGRGYGYSEHGTRGVPPDEYGGYGSERSLWPGRGYAYGDYGARDFPLEEEMRNPGRYASPEEELSGGRGYGYSEFGGRGRPRARGGYELESELWRGRGYGYGQYGMSEAERMGTERRRELDGGRPTQSGQEIGREDYYYDEWMIAGPYTGAGPEGYSRSDERIAEDVCERLARHGRLDARGLQVKVQDGVVTLSGSVDSRRAKRMAEDTAESVFGVKDVHNELSVEKKS